MSRNAKARQEFVDDLGGIATIDETWQYAISNPDSALYASMTTDPCQALRKCQLAELRQTLWKATDVVDGVTVRAIPSVRCSDGRRRYVDVDIVRQSQAMSSAVVEDQKRRTVRSKRRYKNLRKAFAPVMTTVGMFDN